MVRDEHEGGTRRLRAERAREVRLSSVRSSIGNGISGASQDLRPKRNELENLDEGQDVRAARAGLRSASTRSNSSRRRSGSAPGRPELLARRGRSAARPTCRRMRSPLASLRGEEVISRDVGRLRRPCATATARTAPVGADRPHGGTRLSVARSYAAVARSWATFAACSRCIIQVPAGNATSRCPVRQRSSASRYAARNARSTRIASRRRAV